jgi:hypothetical protein
MAVLATARHCIDNAKTVYSFAMRDASLILFEICSKSISIGAESYWTTTSIRHFFYYAINVQITRFVENIERTRFFIEEVDIDDPRKRNEKNRKNYTDCNP